MIAALFSIALSVTLLTAAIYCWAQSTIHRGRAEAFQQVADDFRGLSHVHWWTNEKEKKRERRKLFLSLALCAPEVRDALREALAEADEKWARYASRDD